MQSLVALLVTVVAASSFVIASPTPQQAAPAPSPSTTPPTVGSPSASIKYLGNGWAQIENNGVPPSQVGQQCRGLAGTLPIEVVAVNTRFPDGRPAYTVQFFEEFNCQGAPVATTSGFQGNGQGLRGTNGQVVVPKSSRFVLLQ
ncbi:hypothetical protein BCR44DRAFT_59870 [Catenaria anguillulae PL171]|uniref:Uncharacterized protein n=1 Tax=Catenaria anguillulae PL171 TaxID=765915 RepID=A0A1Y2HNA7_9FUNG|nr:hypothetical protein BCR44DRAFT_59870 [Catenaria anguillulae PL171]